MKIKISVISLCTCVFLACLGSNSFAARQRVAGTANKPTAQGPRQEANLKISFKFKFEGVESFGNLVGLSGSQLTYYKAYKTLSPDKAGKCAESAKYGTQVQCLPVELTDKPGLVRMSCHFYMSAPKQAADKSATTAAVFDLTNDIVAALGRTMVLVDEPDKHLELAVEKLQP